MFQRCFELDCDDVWHLVGMQNRVALLANQLQNRMASPVKLRPQNRRQVLLFDDVGADHVLL